MLTADLVKETATGTGPFTLTGAASGFRAFAAAFPSGATGVMVAVSEPSTGARLTGLATISGNTLTITSTETTVGTFGASAKEVACTVTAAQLKRMASADAAPTTAIADPTKKSFLLVNEDTGAVERITAAAALTALGASVTDLATAILADGFLFTLTDPTTGLEYKATVAAVKAFMGVSAAPAAVPPGAPTITNVTPGDSSLTVTYQAPSVTGSSPITKYTARVYLGSISVTDVDSVGTALSIAVPGLINGNAYTVEMVAVSAAGVGTAAVWGSAVTPQVPTTKPGTPVIVSATPGNGSMTLVVTAGTGGAPMNFSAQVYTAAGVVVGSPVVQASGSFTLGSLTNGQDYYAVVSASNNVGVCDTPATSATVRPAALAAAPTGVAVTPADGGGTVTFTAPTDTGGSAITGYKATVGSQTFNSVGTATSIVMSGLTNGVQAGVTVQAVTAVGAGTASSPAVNFTPAAAPGKPVLTLGTATDTAQVLTWTAAAANGSVIADYSIQYRVVGSGTWLNFTHTASTALNAIVTGLSATTNYEYQVAGVNGIGTGTYSDVKSGSTTAAMTSYTVNPNSAGNVVKLTQNVSGQAPGSNGKKVIGYAAQFTINQYWALTPTPASDGVATSGAYHGWLPAGTVTDDVTPTASVAKITTTQHTSGGLNGLMPMSKPGAFASSANLNIDVGSGTTNWDYVIAPVGGKVRVLNQMVSIQGAGNTGPVVVSGG